MPVRSLPSHPNLTQLKLQAKELLRCHHERQLSAAARIASHHPRLRGHTLATVRDTAIALADAQLVIAREYGFAGWAQLKRHVEMAHRLAHSETHPRFGAALTALDHGEAGRLRALLASEASLVRARTQLDPPYGYFTGATLLHHVAGNPAREQPLPPNIVDIARVLLEAGADVNAATLGPHGGTTMALVVTSRQASVANVSGPLIELLLEFGARLDLHDVDLLDAPLANHAPRAAEKLIELGARVDVLAAAALGRMDLLEASFTDDGSLRTRPKRRGKVLSERDAIGLALLFAYVNKQTAAVDYLIDKDGNWNMIGVNNGTALHRAAWDGDLAMVRRLVAKGADVNDRNNPFTGTPLAWAHHNQQHAVAAWLASNTQVDLHDAVAFELGPQAIARLREAPGSVNATIDDAELSRSAALHWAAALNRAAMAELLLQHGADIDALAGNGLTALDIAEQARAEAVARILRSRGGKPSSAL